MRADAEAGMCLRSAKQGEGSCPLRMRGRVQMTVALLVFWALEHFTNVNLSYVVEGDPRTGWVGERGLWSWRTGEVGKAGRGRVPAPGARTGTKNHPEPLKSCSSTGQDVVLMSVNNLLHFLTRLPKTYELDCQSVTMRL